MKKIIFNEDNNLEEEINLLNDEDYFINLVSQKYLNKEIVISPMFTVPLLHIKISNWQIKKQKLLELFNSGKEWFSNRSEEKVNSTYSYISHENDPIKDSSRIVWEKNMSKSLDYIFYEERKIIYECFGDPEKFPDEIANISYSWFQEQKNGMFHAPHTHGAFPGSLGSVCFIEFDETVHTPTKFICPYPNNSKYNIQETYVEKNISSGSLIVFPSNIFHYTLPTYHEKSRIILSMNITV